MTNLIIGRYRQGPVMITTSWAGTQYETHVKSPNFNNGRMYTASKYGLDSTLATKGHDFWVSQITGLTKNVSDAIGKAHRMKISLSSLVRILYDYIGENQLFIKPMATAPDMLIISIPTESKYAGSCTYDLGVLEASNLTGLWKSILEEKRAEIVDRQVDKKILTAKGG